ncbi:MAG: DUF1553 domain-containing protein [Verrucomicrobia bacterium]|nr:DUF1553 domain-containing protein [Verrucomicrobiota bacterium]
MVEGRAAGLVTNAVVRVEGGAVRLENDFLHPVSNGRATLRVEDGRDTASVEISVTGFDQESGWSFRNHVQPVLARAGCSSGACHGAAAGQNNFRLSLRGYDDEGDFRSITRHASGRRVVPSDPGRSLLLLKATGAVPHKGGVRFAPDSIEYRVLSGWIAQGAPGPSAKDPRIERIEVMPDRVRLRVGDQQQFLVMAHFNDGRVEDVTHWAKFTAANGAVAQVDEHGRVSIVGSGESAITAWYLSRIALASVAAPYTNAVPKGSLAKASRRNFVDEQVLAQLESLNLPPSPRCSDSEFIRRVYLDTLGVLPSADEAREFLKDRRADKRDRLIERIFDRPEFVDYWTYKWSDLLLVQSRKLKGAAMWSFYRWLRHHVERNTPWDKLVRELVTSRGSTLDHGAANFFVMHEDPRLMAENTSLAFLGMSINCARCHNHPMEKWTNDQYFQFANLFARVRAKVGTADGEAVVFEAAEGEVIQPLTGKALTPAPLDGEPMADARAQDRRSHLADWLVAPGNPYFAKAIVNRVWANFFGVGLVMNVDDLRATNPPSNPGLMDALAGHLAKSKFDLRALIRSILQSETYQRSSQAMAANAGDSKYHSRYYPKRMMAEVLLDAVSQVTGQPTEFSGYPAGWRALQLPDANVDSYFLKTFGRPERERTCECERTSESNVAQVLHLANGGTLNAKIASEKGRVRQWIREKKAPGDIVEEAYLSALSRPPAMEERDRLLKLIEEAGEDGRTTAVEDLLWALLNSKEFLFNH